MSILGRIFHTLRVWTGLADASAAVQRRALYLNGAPAQAADFAELVPVLWLTPAMDRLFLEGASERRRFLDRLVFGLDVQVGRALRDGVVDHELEQADDR